MLNLLSFSSIALLPTEEIGEVERALYIVLSSVGIILFTLLLENGIEEYLKEGLRRSWKTCKSWLNLVWSVLLVASIYAGFVGGFAEPPKPSPVSVEARGNLLFAYSDDGDVVWTTTFESTIVSHSPLFDLDGGGSKEVVIATAPHRNSSSRLVIMSERKEIMFDSLATDANEIFPGQRAYRYAPHSSRYEITDMAITSVDRDEEREVTLVVNDSYGRGSASKVIILDHDRREGWRVKSSLWHLGPLRQVHVLGPDYDAPIILILTENGLVGNASDGDAASAVFALSAETTSLDDCWNETDAIAKTLGLDRAQAQLLLDSEGWVDVSPELGCGEGSEGLLWYRWVEPTSVQIRNMTVVLATFPLLPRVPVLPGDRTKEWIALVNLSDGCLFRLTYEGRTRSGLTVPLTPPGVQQCTPGVRLRP